MGLVLVAGMTIGTRFTLLLLPAIYLLIARDRRAVRTANEDLAPPESGQALGRPLRAG